MINKKFVIQPLAVAALMLSAGASHAAFVNTFTSLASFNAGTVQQGTDLFDGLSISGGTPSPLTRNTAFGTAYSYSADTCRLNPDTVGLPCLRQGQPPIEVPGDIFFGGGTFANPFLATNTATDAILLKNFSPAIRAIGGNFFGSDVSGWFTVGTITIIVNDSLGATLTQTITNAAQAGFFGVLSNGFITSMEVSVVQPAGGFIWPAADNLVMAIPEPGTYALMLAGLGFVGFMARRRRA